MTKLLVSMTLTKTVDREFDTVEERDSLEAEALSDPELFMIESDTMDVQVDVVPE